MSVLAKLSRRMMRAAAVCGLGATVLYAVDVEQWGIFEVTLNGPSTGNPYADVTLSADFTNGSVTLKPDGFYDDAGVYKIRCMPTAQGAWTYTTHSSAPELDGKTGGFTCVAPSSGNHGPVHVKDKYHFAHDDGTRFNHVGTTCYYWNNQGRTLEDKTFAILRQQKFNKLRYAVFPLSYAYISMEPQNHIYSDMGTWKKFNPKFWKRFDEQLDSLIRLDIEADLIVFHPYDRWGYKSMGMTANKNFLKYLIARVAAYRNVWWAMCNEFQLMGWSVSDFDALGTYVMTVDPYNHLRSIHDVFSPYDNSKPWVTHASRQTHDLELGSYRQQLGKPVVVDEMGYEGNILGGAGGQSPQEETRRFWIATINGVYAGHSETYSNPNNVIWWSTGGILVGQSPARIAFLKRIMDESPAVGFDKIDATSAKKGTSYYLFYYGNSQAASRSVTVPSDRNYQVDILDTWNMKVTPVSGAFKGTFTVNMPSQQFMGIRVYDATTGIAPTTVRLSNAPLAVAQSRQIALKGAALLPWHTAVSDLMGRSVTDGLDKARSSGASVSGLYVLDKVTR